MGKARLICAIVLLGCVDRHGVGMEDEVNLWLLALVPVYLFVWAATLGKAMMWLANKALDGGNWWALPAYISFGFSAVGLGMVGLVIIITNAFWGA